MNEVRIGHSEAAALAIICIGAKAFLGFPRFLAKMGATAGWMIILLAGIFSMVIWFGLSFLLQRYPGKSLTQITNHVVGKNLGLVFNGVILIYIIVATSIHLRLFSEAVVITALPQAPISALALLFLISVWIATHLGLEALSRSAAIAFPYLLIGVLAVLIALYPFWDFKNLLPFLGEGVTAVVTNGFFNITSFGEIFILAYLASFFSFSARRLRNVGLFSLGFVTLAFLFIVIVYLMVFPMPVATETLAPFYQLSRQIFLGRYFQRVEAVFVLFWTFTAFFYLSAGIIVSAVIIKEAVEIPYHRPLIPVLSIFIYCLALTPGDIVEIININRLLIVYGWAIIFAIPCLVWVLAMIKGKRGGPVDAQQQEEK